MKTIVRNDTFPGGGKLWNRQYVLLSAVNFFSWLSYNMIASVLQGYFVSLGASLSLAGTVCGLFALASLFSRPVSGVMSDCLNRAKLMSGFTVLMTLSLLAYSLSRDMTVILVFRAIHGVAFGLSSTASLVLVSECTPEERLGEAVSYYGVVQIASMAVGPGLGLWICGQYGYRACLLTACAMLAVASAAAFAFPYQAPPARKPRSLSLSDLAEKKVAGLSAVNASFTLISGVVSTFLVAFAAERNIGGVDWHFALNAAALMLSRAFLAKAADRRPLKWNLYPSFLFGIATLAAVCAARNVWWLLAAAVLKALAQGISGPALQAAALRSVPRERRGVACSTMYIGGDLGQAAGPIAGGFLAQAVGYSGMFACCIIPLAAAFLFFALAQRRKNAAVPAAEE